LHFGLSLSFLPTGPAATEIYPLSLHDALPILRPAEIDAVRGHLLRFLDHARRMQKRLRRNAADVQTDAAERRPALDQRDVESERSEEHTSELQSRENLVCRLLLEKKNNYQKAR